MSDEGTSTSTTTPMMRSNDYLFIAGVFIVVFILQVFIIGRRGGT